MLPASYKKIIVTDITPDPHAALAIVEAKMTAPAPHEIIVRQHYAGLNNSDLGRMAGITPASRKPPFDFGLEAIGEVVQIGDNVTTLQVGDAVITAMIGTGYREYTRIAANLAIKLPGLKPTYMPLLLSGATAKICLDYLADIRADDLVLVTAALGSSGHIAVQLAKQAGCTVIGTCGNGDEVVLAREIGVDHVIDRSRDDLSAVLKADYDQQITLIYDTEGGSVLDSCLPFVSPRARVVLAEALREHSNPDEAAHRLQLFEWVIMRSVTIFGFNLSDYASIVPTEAGKLLNLYERGMLRPLVDPQTFSGVEAIPDALAYLASGKAQGKVIVQLAT